MLYSAMALLKACGLLDSERVAKFYAVCSGLPQLQVGLVLERTEIVAGINPEIQAMHGIVLVRQVSAPECDADVVVLVSTCVEPVTAYWHRATAALSPIRLWYRSSRSSRAATVPVDDASSALSKISAASGPR